MFGHTGGMFFGGGILMWVFWLVLIIALVYALKFIFSSTNKSASSDEAMEILKKRFARGEIDEAEFEERKKQLQ